MIECALYLGEEAGDETAERFLEAVEVTLEGLVSMPEMGSPRELGNLRLRGLRQWPVKDFPNYLLFYIPTEVGIAVARLLHAARDRDAILGDE